MIVKKFVLGEIGENCYCISTEKNNAVVVDPGIISVELYNYINENKLNLKKILLTHGHFDHICGSEDLREKTDAEIYVHKDDAELLNSVKKSLAFWMPDCGFKPFSADILLSDGDKIQLDELEFSVMQTSGHTKGSVCYICENSIFCGDTLFHGSTGRCDVYSSSPDDMCKSLRLLSELKDDYTLYCGHGENSTLLWEKQNNPYLA